MPLRWCPSLAYFSFAFAEPNAYVRPLDAYVRGMCGRFTSLGIVRKPRRHIGGGLETRPTCEEVGVDFRNRYQHVNIYFVSFALSLLMLLLCGQESAESEFEPCRPECYSQW